MELGKGLAGSPGEKGGAGPAEHDGVCVFSVHTVFMKREQIPEVNVAKSAQATSSSYPTGKISQVSSNLPTPSPARLAIPCRASPVLAPLTLIDTLSYRIVMAFKLKVKPCIWGEIPLDTLSPSCDPKCGEPRGPVSWSRHHDARGIPHKPNPDQEEPLIVWERVIGSWRTSTVGVTGSAVALYLFQSLGCQWPTYQQWGAVILPALAGILVKERAK